MSSVYLPYTSDPPPTCPPVFQQTWHPSSSTPPTLSRLGIESHQGSVAYCPHDTILASIMPSPTDDESETPFPTLNDSSTFTSHLLSPDDAFISPPRRGYTADSAVESHMRRVNASRSGSRRRKRVWKKLMWVKQSCMLRHSPSKTNGQRLIAI